MLLNSKVHSHPLLVCSEQALWAAVVARTKESLLDPVVCGVMWSSTLGFTRHANAALC